MKNKRFVRIVAIVLAFIMLLSVGMVALDILFSDRASARVTQAQIDRLRARQREYERQRREVQSEIYSIEFERRSEIARKSVLDERIIITGHEIENTLAIISYYNMLIREKEYDVFLATVREEEQLRLFQTRVRDMEENGIITFLEIIFDSTSFSDLLARIDFVADIMRADEQAYANLVQARYETEEAMEALEETRISLTEEKALLEQREAELEEKQREAEALIRQIEENLDASRELHAMFQAQSEEMDREVAAAVAELRRQEELERQRRQREQQQRAAAAAGGGGGGGGGSSSGGGGGAVVGTGELTWPAQGRITSAFGMRRHPVFGDNRFHGGIDIGAPHGASVVAADSGTVVQSTYNSSFGNLIVIDHGNGMQTWYAHLSARHVSVGAAVSRGQVIGLVGSTGIATGPHLHFEVHVGGSRINPVTRL